MIGIYKITSPSGKIYIGQSDNIKKRLTDYSIKNTKTQPALCNSFKKYGKENHIFEIVEECEYINLNIQERYWQDYYDVIGPNGLNCLLTKIEGKTKNTSIESHLRRSLAIKAAWTDERREQMSQLGKNKIFSEETRAKISQKTKGRFYRRVIDTKTGQIFNSIKDAAKANNINYSRLACMLLGQNPNKTNMRYYEENE